MSKKLPFWKYESCGNDLILVEDHHSSFQETSKIMQAWIRYMCARKTGIGADGLVVLRRNQPDHFTMFYFNCDGTLAGFCGNAVLCISKHIGKQELTVSCGQNTVVTRNLEKAWHSFSMQGAFDVQLNQTFSGIKEPVHFATSGVRHAVIFSETPSKAVAKNMRTLLDANINFVQKSGDSYRLTTFEKGVEDFTWGCASASSAIASICYFLHNDLGPFTIVSKGGVLHIDLTFELEAPEKQSVKTTRILGLPRLVYKGFGEHYESWDTERSQESRIPSWAYS